MSKPPRVPAYFTTEEWQIIADCVLDSASGPTVAHALASKKLKPIYDRLVTASQRQAIARTKNKTLSGAAAASVAKKHARLVADPVSTKVEGPMQMLSATLRTYGGGGGMVGAGGVGGIGGGGGSPRSWHDQVIGILKNDRSVAGQREAIAKCRELTGLSFQPARETIEGILEEMGE